MMKALLAGVIYFGIAFTAAFILGAIRQLLVMPLIGPMVGTALELPLMLAVSWLAARAVVERLQIPVSIMPRLVMGIVAFILLQAAELALGYVMLGMDVSGYVASLTTPHGILGFVGQLAFGVMPLLVRGAR
jgi:uncharacterized membrane protein